MASELQRTCTSQFFNQALDLINDPQATPQAPVQTVIEEVFQLALEAQILADDLDSIMPENVCGITVEKRLIPIVRFGFNEYTMGARGQKTVQRFASDILEKRPMPLVAVIGHSDSKGSDAACL